MNVSITIDGTTIHLTEVEQWALRQACATEQHGFLKRRDNIKSVHLKDRFMNQALFLEAVANTLIGK